MNFHLSMVLALLAGASSLAQEAVPAAKTTPPAVKQTKEYGLPRIKIKLAPPQVGDPKTTHPKALVGRGLLADRHYTLVLDGTKADGDLNVLRLISNNPEENIDIKMEPNVPQTYSVDNEGPVFRAIFLPGTNLVLGGLLCMTKEDVRMFETTLVKGLKAKCDFAGQEEEVIIFDSNNNDRLGDQGVFPCDQDGFPLATYSRPSHQTGDLAIIGRTAVNHLGLPFIKNGVAWTLAVADGQIVLRRHDCKMGEIRWEGEGTQVFLGLIGKSQIEPELFPPDQRWFLPVGEYRLGVFFYQQGGGRVYVSIGGDFVFNKAYKTLMINPGKPIVLGPITKVATRITAKSMDSNRNILLTLDLVTPDGNTVGFSPQKSDLKPPRIRILDATGKEILKDRFSKGTGYSSSYTWVVPPEMKGRVTVEPILETKEFPFRVAVEKTTLAL